MIPHVQLVTPVLHVTNLATALEFYTGVPGFTIDFQRKDVYCGLLFGDVLIPLSQGFGDTGSSPFEIVESQQAGQGPEALRE